MLSLLSRRLHEPDSQSCISPDARRQQSRQAAKLERQHAYSGALERFASPQEFQLALAAFLRQTDDSMSRSLLRFFALLILALLGAPVAMHVVLHDLAHHEAEHAQAEISGGDHGEHEHPLVAAAAPRTPRASVATVALLPAIPLRTAQQSAAMDRNVMSHGALRSDHDVGLPLLLSTLLI